MKRLDFLKLAGVAGGGFLLFGAQPIEAVPLRLPADEGAYVEFNDGRRPLLWLGVFKGMV